MYAYEIGWDIDIDEALEKFKEAGSQEQAQVVNLPVEMVQSADECLILDLARDKFHHSPGLLQDFMGLPEKVEIPEDVFDEDEDDAIADWLSDEYGCCLNGFLLSTDKSDRRLLLKNVSEEDMFDIADFLTKHDIDFDEVIL